MMKNEQQTAIDSLVDVARKLGATHAAVISSEEIVVEEALARRCNQGECENYGTSAGCPPYVKGPDDFRKFIERLKAALVFKIEVPSSAFFSHQRREIFILLHEMTASIESAAKKLGFADSMGFASGGCKRLFCSDFSECSVLAGDVCRNPDLARPSMSGYGINVAGLLQSAGSAMTWVDKKDASDGESTAPVVGLLLIG